MNQKESIDYLGYSISLDHIAIAKGAERKIREKIGYLLYQNLVQPLRKGIFNKGRFASGIDMDYVTALRQVRHFLYGGLTDEKLSNYLKGRVPNINFRGLMSYYPLVSDIEQLARLDGWMNYVFRQSLLLRQRLWTPKGVGALPGPVPGWIDQLGSLEEHSLPTGEKLDLRLPSFRLINRAMQLAISRKGVGAVANPSLPYYS